MTLTYLHVIITSKLSVFVAFVSLKSREFNVELKTVQK